MEYPNKAEKATPKHMELARKMADEIMMFPPGDQSEMIFDIRDRITRKMRDQVEEAKMKIDTLEKFISQL